MNPTKKLFDYAKVLSTIGHFASKQGMSDVCVMEFEDGMILTGATFYETGEILNRQIVTRVFSTEELQKMAKGG